MNILPRLRHIPAKLAPEWTVTTMLLIVALSLRLSLHSFPGWPEVDSLLSFSSSVLATYLFIFAVLGLVLATPALIRADKDANILRATWQHVSDAFCWASVVTLALYIKLLVPLIRPTTYDRLFEAIDQACFTWLNPLITWRAHHLQFGWYNYFYVYVLLSMFPVSFIAHDLKRRSEFKRVFLASLLVQAIGSILYLATPAIGPFLYHRGANFAVVHMEHHLYATRQAEMAGGVTWLSRNIGSSLTAGVGAMPSLHAAVSFVFFFYAWRYIRPLGVIYGIVFVWILFSAMATRWHYGVDLIAGLALAGFCISLSNRWISIREEAMDTSNENDADIAVPVLADN